MFLSIVTLLHNRLFDASVAINSLLRQARGLDFEIILIDNNSSEPSEDLQREFEHEARVTLVKRNRLASPMAWASGRNLGYAVASGDWILSLDPDCVVAPGYVEALTRTLSTASATDIFTGERVFVDPIESVRRQARLDPEVVALETPVRSVANHRIEKDKRLPAALGLPLVAHPWDYAHGGNIAYSATLARSIWQDSDFDGNHGYEDIEFAYRMVRDGGCQVRWQDSMLVYHLEAASSEVQPNRQLRDANPNWHRVCQCIPGYLEFKRSQYRRRGIDIAI